MDKVKMELIKVQEVVLHLHPIAKIRVVGDTATWLTPSGSVYTLDAQSALTSLESVCDGLRSSLQWQKTRCGIVKMGKTTQDASEESDGDGGGISIA